MSTGNVIFADSNTKQSTKKSSMATIQGIFRRLSIFLHTLVLFLFTMFAMPAHAILITSVTLDGPQKLHAGETGTYTISITGTGTLFQNQLFFDVYEDDPLSNDHLVGPKAIGFAELPGDPVNDSFSFTLSPGVCGAFSVTCLVGSAGTSWETENEVFVRISDLTHNLATSNTLKVTIPEPITLALFGLGLAGISVSRRRAKI